MALEIESLHVTYRQDDPEKLIIHPSATHPEMEVSVTAINELKPFHYMEITQNLNYVFYWKKCFDGKFSIIRAKSSGMTSLMLASALDSSVPLVKDMIDIYEQDINAKDSEGRTALHYAVMHNQLAIVEYLIENGASINEPDNKGNVPLIYAAFKGNYYLANYLLGRDLLWIVS